jgi:hypothetical protein
MQAQKGRSTPAYNYSVTDGMCILDSYNAAEKAVCLVVTGGDALRARVLYENEDFFDVYDMYAQTLAYNFIPFNPP